MKTLLLLSVLLTACGGGSFAASPDHDPEAGAAGDPAGSGGSETGGTASQGGTAGTLAGSGGEPGGAPTTGGSDSGGAAGSAGAAPGGTGGTPSPSCAPEEAIVFPESFSWDGFSARFDDVDESYCASSPGGTCTFRNLTLTVNTDRHTVSFMGYPDCNATFQSGKCGAEALCGSTSIDPQGFFTVDFNYAPSGNGYVLSGGTGTPPALHNEQACWTELSSGSYAAPVGEARVDIHQDLMDELKAESFPCP